MERDGACALRAPFVLLSSMVGCFTDIMLENGLEIFSHEGIEFLLMRIRPEDSK